MPSLNTPVQRLKVAFLPLDLPCSGPITHSGENLTTGKSHGKKPDRFLFIQWKTKWSHDDYNTNKSNISESTKDVFCDDRCTDSLPDSSHTIDSDEKSLPAGMNTEYIL